MASGIENYLNTLIFSIIAKAVTIVLLILVFTEVGQLVAWLLITIELGLILIIVTALISITKYDKNKKEQLEKFLKSNVYTTTCPDYHTRVIDQESASKCINEYNSPDRSTYKFKSRTFELEPLYWDKLNKKQLPFNELCTNMQKSTSNLEKVAWTDLKEKCDITAN